MEVLEGLEPRACTVVIAKFPASGRQGLLPPPEYGRPLPHAKARHHATMVCVEGLDA